MAKFKLRDYKREDNKMLIYLVFYYQGNSTPFKFNTGESIEEKYWDKKKERARLTEPNAININERLDRISHALNDIYDPNIKTNNGVLKSKLVRELDSKSNINVSFFEFAERDNERLRPSTKITWDATLVTLRKFQAVFGTLTFDSFDMYFYNKFKKYCMDILNYSDATFSSKVGHLKRILGNAESAGIEVNQGYKNNDFKKIAYKSDSVYLDREELKQLIDCDFSDNKSLEFIRDSFVLRCYIGTRFNDSSIKKSNLINVKGVELLKFYTSKSNKDVYIPVHPIAREILDKYDWELKGLSNNYTNKRIKEVCKKAGINKTVLVSVRRGGVTRMVEKKKWELISTHTARRTVATNMFLDNVNISLISSIMGHSKEAQTVEYIKADTLNKALVAAESDFFIN